MIVGTGSSEFLVQSLRAADQLLCGSCEEPVGASKARCRVDGPLCESCAYDLLGQHYGAVRDARSEDDLPSGEPPTCPGCGEEPELYTERPDASNYYHGVFDLSCTCATFDSDRVWTA